MIFSILFVCHYKYEANNKSIESGLYQGGGRAIHTTRVQYIPRRKNEKFILYFNGIKIMISNYLNGVKEKKYKHLKKVHNRSII